MGIAESALEAAHGTDGSAEKDHFSIAGGLLIFWCGTAAGGLPNFVTWSLFVPNQLKGSRFRNADYLADQGLPGSRRSELPRSGRVRDSLISNWQRL